MVFRKPYAFLIKNFKKIHIVLIVLCAYIYYKTISLSGFTNDFLNYLSYDPYFEPISKYINVLLYFVIIVTVTANILLLIVLKRKDKPWKLYLVPVLEYIVLFFVLISIHSFFINYDGDLSTTSIRLLNNLLFLTTFPQYFIFLILIIRIIGLDLKNFNFSADEEFLELSQEDREEFEVSFTFDKYAFLRAFKKVQRILTYFYKEHKYFCNIIFIVLTVYFLGSVYYYFGVSHKVIKEGQSNNINNYQITINKSYYTNKDKVGDVLEKNKAFVIINMTVVNTGSTRTFNADDFRIVNGSKGYSYASDTYSNDFSDLGDGVPKDKLQNGQKKTFALIFKVDKNLNPKHFVLYYQEYKMNKVSYLRKIKLNQNDISTVSQDSLKDIGSQIEISDPLSGDEKKLAFDEVAFESSVNYNIETCNQQDECSIVSKFYEASSNKKILKIKFSSPDFEGEDLIDFSIKYGKIVYRDNDNITREIKVENAVDTKKYLGKFLYVKVPKDVENSKEIKFIYVVRNQKYIYKIR